MDRNIWGSMHDRRSRFLDAKVISGSFFISFFNFVGYWCWSYTLPINLWHEYMAHDEKHIVKEGTRREWTDILTSREEMRHTAGYTRRTETSSAPRATPWKEYGSSLYYSIHSVKIRLPWPRHLSARRILFPARLCKGGYLTTVMFHYLVPHCHKEHSRLSQWRKILILLL